jgi:hypothetical protein
MGTSVDATSVAEASVTVDSAVVDVSLDPHAARVTTRTEINRDGFLKYFFDIVKHSSEQRIAKYGGCVRIRIFL